MVAPIVLALAMLQAAAPKPATVIEIDGTLTAADRLTWIERPFDVPAGTARIDVETSFTDGDRGTALEFGLYDPVRFRGASRFSKIALLHQPHRGDGVLLAGELQAGRWRLLIGVPSIRDGVTSRYRVLHSSDA